jgi:hypothetical protein
LLLILFICAPMLLSAQSTFMQSVGGSAVDRAWSITQTASHDFVIAGVSMSFGVNNSDMYIVSFQPDGSLNWHKNIGGAENEAASSLIHTNDGGFLMVGNSYEFGQYSGMMAVKLSPDGQIDWQYRIDGFSAGFARHDLAHSVVQTADGGYVIVGETYSPFAIPPWGTFIFLVKLESNGDLAWASAIGGAHNPNQASRDTRGYEIIESNDGGLVIAGYTAAFGAGNNDMFLTKLNAAGIHRWSKTYGGPADDRANSVIQTEDGGFLLVGFTGSFGIGGGYENAYIVKTDADGELEWSRSVGGTGPGTEVGYAAVQTNGGDYVVAGFSANFNSSAYLIKLDPQGNVRWSKTITGFSQDFATSIIEASDNTLVLAGYTLSFSHTPSVPSMLIAKLDTQDDACGYTTLRESTLFPTNSIVTEPTPAIYTLATQFTSNNINMSSNGSVIEVCFTTGIDDQNIATGNDLFRYFPNPANDEVEIRYSLQETMLVNLRILNVYGQELDVLTNTLQHPGDYKLNHNLSHLPVGLYFLDLQTEEIRQTIRLIVSR